MRSPLCPTRKELLKVNKHTYPKFVLSDKDFPCLNKSHPQTNASRSSEEEYLRTASHEKFEKCAAVDLAYKAMVCFGVALSASSGDRNRFNKNRLKLFEENGIPKVYVKTIDIFFPTNPPLQHVTSLKDQPLQTSQLLIFSIILLTSSRPHVLNSPHQLRVTTQLQKERSLLTAKERKLFLRQLRTLNHPVPH